MISAFLQLLPKIRRRLPQSLGQSRFLQTLEDKIATRCFFKSRDIAQLNASRVKCRTIDNHFDFAGKVFPSHQIRTEILAFLEFAAGESPRIIAEIGTAQGGTNYLLGQALPSTELVLGIDIFVRNTTLLRDFNLRRIEQVYVNGSSYSPATVERVGELLSGRKLDLLFIDGDHSYEGVKQDFLGYRDFVRRGGLIAFHDIVPDFLTSRGEHTGRCAGDVPVFWAEVKEGFDHWEFVENRDQDGFGIGVIRYEGAKRAKEQPAG